MTNNKSSTEIFFSDGLRALIHGTKFAESLCLSGQNTDVFDKSVSDVVGKQSCQIGIVKV